MIDGLLFIVYYSDDGSPFAADASESDFHNPVAEEVLSVGDRIGAVNIAVRIPRV